MIASVNPRSESRTSSLLDDLSELRGRYEASTSAEQRKQRGQYFTPPSVAAFMAGLISRFPKDVRVLDPGAGTGTLSASICDRVLRLRSPRQIEFTLYETDRTIIPILEEGMKRCRSALREAGHDMAYEIRVDDFILSNPHAFQQQTLFDERTPPNKYDVAIMNPPYFKIQKNSAHARLANRIVHGQPNIYALFMALAAEMLRSGGKLVAITPRSFCGGPYFREFRQWFLKRMSLRHIHLFGSRKETFRGAKVLQENVITSAVRSDAQPTNIRLSTSLGADVPKKPRHRDMETARIIDDTCGELVIRIPEHPEDARIMEFVEAWPRRFTEHGLRVSTGPVVMFRAREFLLDAAGEQDSAPLLSVHNITPFDTVWPVRKNGKPVAFKVCAASLNRRLLVPAGNYVLLRRFSAKEERRRLTASCLLSTNELGPYLALENHLNYVFHADRKLHADEVYGLAALFNSALLDRYFRSLSGNTQVNATELRTMKLPDLATVARIGQRIRVLGRFTTEEAERVVLDELDVNGSLEQHLRELAR